eukprot:71999-Hanusia_phi.AAC.1
MIGSDPPGCRSLRVSEGPGAGWTAGFQLDLAKFSDQDNNSGARVPRAYGTGVLLMSLQVIFIRESPIAEQTQRCDLSLARSLAHHSIAGSN